jgi:hypothetical protein
MSSLFANGCDNSLGGVLTRMAFFTRDWLLELTGAGVSPSGEFSCLARPFPKE